MEFRTIEYNTVEYIEMVELRNDVRLEPAGDPYAEDVFVDDEGSTFCACYDDGELLACCVLTDQGEDVVRLRQMAVVEEKRRQGVGAKLLDFAESVAKNEGFGEVILHAQRVAEGFYAKCGYEAYGSEFEEAGILHIMMKKKLNTTL